jgi:hypothetical protein
MKRVFNFGTHAGLQVFQLFLQASQFGLRQRLAFGALHGHVPLTDLPMFSYTGLSSEGRWDGCPLSATAKSVNDS